MLLRVAWANTVHQGMKVEFWSQVRRKRPAPWPHRTEQD
jgi:hypothetical protein